MGLLLHSSTYFISSSTRFSFHYELLTQHYHHPQLHHRCLPHSKNFVPKMSFGNPLPNFTWLLVLLHHLLVNQHCLVAKLLYQQNYCIIITRFFHFLFSSLNNRYQCFKRWHLSYIWFDTLTNKKANFTVKTAGLMNFASFIVISKCIRHNLCDVSLSSFFRWFMHVMISKNRCWEITFKTSVLKYFAIFKIKKPALESHLALRLATLSK